MNPIYIAHRGSRVNGGVENTKEAFLGGSKAKAGGLECDVRVTKDGCFIISHDETLERLTLNSDVKSTKNVNEENFFEIKDIVLSQNYDNKTYYGKICTFEEYLKICENNNLIPIIELKWTNGIYSNNENVADYDYSNLDKLVDYIKKYNLYNKAVVMSSMRGCLNYLRMNYPILQLQWLCTSNVIDYIDWCMEKNISIDVIYTSCTKEVVDKCHKHNLIVNIWTLNDENLLNKYVEMGVDMVTSDYLIK